MKLPDIDFGRSVQELKSPKAAALPNQLRGIAAATAGVSNAAATIGKAVDDRADAEATIAAARIGNTISREFVAADVELRTQYMNNTKFDPKMYKQDRESTRERIISANSANLSGRQQRRLESHVSKYRGGEFEAQTQRTMLELTTARAGYELELLAVSTLQDIELSPSSADASIALYKQTVEDAQVGTPQSRHSLIRAYSVEARTQQINGLIRDGQLSDAYDVLDQDGGDLLRGKIHSDLLARVAAASEANVNNIIEKEGNLLLSDPDLFDGQDHLNEVLTQLPSETIVTEQATDQYNKGRFDQYVKGLINMQRYDEAREQLNNTHNAGLMSGDAKNAHLKSLEGKASAAWAGDSAGLFSDAKDYTHKMLIDGVVNPAFTTNLTALRDSAATPAQRQRVQEALDNITLGEDFATQFVAGVNDMSATEMNSLKPDAKTWAEGADNSILRGKIYAQWESGIAERQEALLNDGAGYLSQYLPEYREGEIKAADALISVLAPVEGDNTPLDTKIAGAQHALAAYYAQVNDGLETRDVPELSRTYIPEDSELWDGLTASLNSIQPEDQHNALVRLNAVINEPNMLRAVQSQLFDDNAGFAAALTYVADGNPQLSKLTLKGYAEVERGEVDSKYLKFRIQALSKGALSGTSQLDKVTDGLMYTLVGSLDGQQRVNTVKKSISGIDPRLDNEYIERLMDMTTGAPFLAGDITEGYTMPYVRTDSGKLVTADEWRAQKEYTARNMIDTQGTELFTPDGRQLNAEEVLARAKFEIVGNGQYAVTLPHSSLITSQSGISYFTVEGSVLNDELKPFILDMNKVPMPSKSARPLSEYYMSKGFPKPTDGGKATFLEDDLKRDEGFRAESYYDNAATPNLTAGYGHKLTPAEREQYPEGTKIPKEVTDAWFKQDVATARTAVASLLIEHNVKQVPTRVTQALQNMAFQMGENGLRNFKRMWAEMKKGNWDGVIAEMKDSAWYSAQSPNRAKRVVDMVATAATGNIG